MLRIEAFFGIHARSEAHELRERPLAFDEECAVLKYFNDCWGNR